MIPYKNFSLWVLIRDSHATHMRLTWFVNEFACKLIWVSYDVFALMQLIWEIMGKNVWDSHGKPEVYMRKYSYATHAKATKTHVLKFLIHEKNRKNSCSHMRKFGKTHMLIHEKNRKNSCAHMRKCFKTHMLMHEKNRKNSCAHMRKCCKTHMRLYEKNR